MKKRQISLGLIDISIKRSLNKFDEFAGYENVHIP
jgi:hypothetical protein